MRDGHRLKSFEDMCAVELGSAFLYVYPFPLLSYSPPFFPYHCLTSLHFRHLITSYLYTVFKLIAHLTCCFALFCCSRSTLTVDGNAYAHIAIYDSQESVKDFIHIRIAGNLLVA